ncbi:arylamine N-acetyltransferase family protein [Marininema halotolerans]|uniref:N-hydroxyarylamine O-acetyltransferase n=1 Tax=Marininema halotolerans TaxID=1155944 RepID=A0A1I6Q088_9BACL|nr:arylamine N-acetyltransferase [Marininema halotolerans]SFS45877.1 N-hydroxyarylamine O-acetyltransferase [Marininema halotolerans]
MNINAYLSRIGIQSIGSPNLPFLTRLQEDHVLHVPFENLDIMADPPVPIQLSIPALYKKVVENGRGGFCYELNGLFHELLQACGYQVSYISARVKNEEGSFGPPFDHLALLVYLDQPYLVDVGFGDHYRSPLPLTGVVHEDISGCYRIMKLEGSKEYELQKQKNGEWATQYRFSVEPCSWESFNSMCDYKQTSPHSKFTQKRICTMATHEGRITLSDKGITITKGKEKTEYPFTSEQPLEWALPYYFGIAL